MSQLTAVMYHYVSDLLFRRFPQIKGLTLSEFKAQLAYFKKQYQFVTVWDCLGVVRGARFRDPLTLASVRLRRRERIDFPSNALLLTFDDGYLCHYQEVFPLLQEHHIQGCFFPPAQAILERKVLDVNKLHFVLASVKNFDSFLKEIFEWLDRYRAKYALQSNDDYFSRLSRQPHPYDSPEVVFVKRLLQVELPEELRGLIVNQLFQKYVTADEASFADELYMTVDQLKELTAAGHCVGSHGYGHDWMDRLPPEKQEREIDLSLEFLRVVGSPLDAWVMSYPYGAYNESLLNILRRRGCRLAFLSRSGMAELTSENSLTLQRLDANDFPKQP